MKEVKAWVLLREDGTMVQNKLTGVYGIFPTREQAVDVLVKAQNIVGKIEPVTIVFTDIIPVDN